MNRLSLYSFLTRHTVVPESWFKVFGSRMDNGFFVQNVIMIALTPDGKSQ
jgi:hypothetical protein